MKFKQKTEYRIYYKNGDIDHVKKKLDIPKTNDIESTYKVIRRWNEDGNLIEESEVIL